MSTDVWRSISSQAMKIAESDESYTVMYMTLMQMQSLLFSLAGSHLMLVVCKDLQARRESLVLEFASRAAASFALHTLHKPIQLLFAVVFRLQHLLCEWGSGPTALTRGKARRSYSRVTRGGLSTHQA